MASSTDMNAMDFPSYVSADIITVTARGATEHHDQLAAEEPLEIRLGHASPSGYATTSLSITMRTPGNDRELAAGFLLSEGVIAKAADIASISESPKPGANIVRVDLAPCVPFDPLSQARHFYTTSSCGVCGKASLEALATRGLQPVPRDTFVFPAPLVHSLSATLREAQPAFEATGGLHASALFSPEGTLLSLREDVGRHNALDKLFGTELLAGRMPLHHRLVMVSGRASFELVQKCLAAGISILAAVGAPSSLAVDLAREFDLTLLGFVRNGRFNIYSGEWRIDYETQNAGQLGAAPVDPE